MMLSALMSPPNVGIVFIVGILATAAGVAMEGGAALEVRPVGGVPLSVVGKCIVQHMISLLELIWQLLSCQILAS